MPFKPGEATNLVHGGEGAVKAIQKGEALRGVARGAELEVINELEAHGVHHIVKRNATRAQAACDLFWAALVDAGKRGDLEKLESYLKRFGWLVGVTGRAWAQYAEMKPDDANAIDYEKMLAQERENND